MNCPHPTLSHLPQIPSPFADFYEAVWRDDELMPPPSPGVVLIAEWDCVPLLFTAMSKEGELFLAIAVDECRNGDGPSHFLTYIAARVPPEWGKERVFTRPIFEKAERVFIVGYEPLQPGQSMVESPLRYWEVRGEEVPKEWLTDEGAFVNDTLRIGALRTNVDRACS